MKKIFFLLVFLFLSELSLADSKLDLGLKIFNEKAECGTCHTLKAVGSNSNIGPNLDQLRPTFEQIVHAVKNGIGVMQAWEGILTAEEIEAVAYYVSVSSE